MTKITSTYPTIESVDFGDLEKGIRRAHRLRSEAFTSLFSDMLHGLFRKASDNRVVDPDGHRDCASMA